MQKSLNAYKTRKRMNCKKTTSPTFECARDDDNVLKTMNFDFTTEEKFTATNRNRKAF